MPHFILTARDDHFWLVGPFGTAEAAAHWGQNPCNNPSDDPRWQVLELADPAEPVMLLSPEQASKMAQTTSVTVSVPDADARAAWRSEMAEPFARDSQ